MGHNSVVVVMNDALHDIATDPAFGANLNAAIARAAGTGKPVDVRAGNHCNAARVVCCHHADDAALVVAGGNTGWQLFTTVMRGDWRCYGIQAMLLKLWANHLGFTLRRTSLDATAARALRAIDNGSTVLRSLHEELACHGYVDDNGVTELGRRMLS